MRRLSAATRAAFLWAIAVIAVVLLWGPITSLVTAGPAQAALALFLSLFCWSLVRGAMDMSAELWAGRHDEARRLEPPAVPAPSKLRDLLIGLALLAISLAVTIAILEGIFRTFLPQPLYAVQFAPWGSWHIPNICLVHGAEPKTEGKLLRGTEFVTTLCYNSLGLRDHEHSLEKPPGEVRIVVLGDSYGEGIEVEFEQTAWQLLEGMLNERLPALRETASRTRRAVPGDATPGSPATDDSAWAATRPLLLALRDEAAATGARLLVANVHYAGSNFDARRRFLDANGIDWVNLALADPETERDVYHYRFDGHWNPRGHERAARLVFEKIAREGLLPIDASRKRVEVINASMSASSTCKMLMVYQAIGKRFSPDLVLLVHTASEPRNLADADMCRVAPSGRVEIHPRSFSPVQEAARAVRGFIKSRSHFGTWVLDRLDAIPVIAELRRQLSGQGETRFIDPDVR